MLLQLACLAVIGWLVYIIKTAFFKPGVSSLPGPFLAKFTGETCNICTMALLLTST